MLMKMMREKSGSSKTQMWYLPKRLKRAFLSQITEFRRVTKLKITTAAIVAIAISKMIAVKGSLRTLGISSMIGLERT